ncbi:MAG TPA: CotH kinase family protein [Polyangiaceae bacterium]|nr:CotH kinase family protein [Polyangiaceae bacterium]
MDRLKIRIEHLIFQAAVGLAALACGSKSFDVTGHDGGGALGQSTRDAAPPRVDTGSVLADAATSKMDAGAALADAAVPAPDLSNQLYDPAVVLDVDISLAPADWDVLRTQTRTVTDILSNCAQGPFPDPFTYFSATVTVAGQTLTQVGVRKKGFLGSLDELKPSLKIKFNEYIPGQKILSLDGLTLNNSKQDPSYVRQCFVYERFRAAGMVAPRCNFAHVHVNGNDMGIYVNVEAIDGDMMDRNYSDGSGNLYEGTLSDFRADWTATFEKKTNKVSPDHSDIDLLTSALTADDAHLVGALTPHLNLDQFYSFWAMEVLVTHWDGYANNTNNFYIYHDPTSDKFEFIPWGADATLLNGPRPFNPDNLTLPTSVAANGLLAHRLYLLPQTRDLYLARLRSLLAASWNETQLIQEIDRMATLVLPIADPDGQKNVAAAIESDRAFVRTRKNAILAELDASAPVWPAPLPDLPCFAPIGSISGTFSTTWGTVGAMNPFLTGSSSVMGTLNGMTLAATAPFGATAGWEQNPPMLPARASIATIASQADGTFLLESFVVPPALFTNGDIPIDIVNVFGAVLKFDPATNALSILAVFLNGTLHLDMSGTTDGEAVTGTFTGTLSKSPF